MILRHLRITNVRNHKSSEFDCPNGVTLLWGENGAGKTSVLEAVSMLCTSRSFVSYQDAPVINRDASTLEIEGTFTSDSGVGHSVRVEHPGTSERKRIVVDGAPLESVADLIGRFPVVVLSPQHRTITTGGPGERRAFMDFVISQIQHSFLVDLLEYRRVLKQRNALLADPSVPDSRMSHLLDPWNTEFASLAARIVRRRKEFLASFFPVFRESMAKIIGEREIPVFSYRDSLQLTDSHGTDPDDIIAALEERMETDRRRGTTGIGPHRDDLLMQLNDLDVRSHSSQGQHKTMLVALKMAESNYIAERLDERPILLLDDAFSELDDGRLNNIFHMIRTPGQVFVTTASSSVAKKFPDSFAKTAVYRIENGNVTRPAEAI